MQIFNNTLVYILSGFQPWVAGITIWPFIFSIHKMKGNRVHLNHERIHLKQEIECLLILYPIIYFGHYAYNRVFKRMDHMTAYDHICFEGEAYLNDNNMNYLVARTPYAWKNYFRK